MDTQTNERDLDALMAELSARDIHLFLREDQLGFDAPAGALTDPLKARIRAARAAVIARLSAPVVAPLSSGQARMWLINRLERGSGDYTEHLAYAYRGPLDHAVLERAIGMVVARHGALRAIFRDGPSGPEMVVSPPGPFILPVVEISPDDLDDALIRAAHRPVDLATGPHVVFTLFVLSDGRRVLSVSAQHAAWDGWSNGVFARDLEAAYAMALKGGDHLPPLARDVTGRLPPIDPEERIERRRRALDGFPTRLRLPTDRPRPPVFDSHGAAITIRIAPAIGAAMTAHAQAAGVTPTMMILAAWGLVLARAARTPRLLIGVPTAGRRDEAEEAMIGYLSETAVVPIDTDGAADLAELTARVRGALLAATADSDVPLDRLIEALAPARGRDTPPLIQTLFSMQPAPVRAPTLGDTPGTVIARHNEAARAEVTLTLEPTGDGGWIGPLTYATALFDRTTAERWADGLLAILGDLPKAWRSPLVGADVSSDAFATLTEARLAAIWGEFLRTPPTHRDDDFFMLGGHSLLLMRLVNRINESGLGSLDLADAMDATTLAKMAALLDKSAPSVPSPSPAAPIEDIHPASPPQEGMWVARRDDPGSLAWMVPYLIGLGRRIDVEAARRALSELVSRHPAMRSTLAEADGKVVERVAAPAPVDPVVHLGLDATARAQVMKDELARPMDVVNGPLYHFVLFRDCPDRSDDAIFMVADHAMIDGWSLDIIARDLRALADRAAGGSTPLPPPPRLVPGDIATSRRATLDGERGRILSQHWTDTLRGMDLGRLPSARTPGPGAARIGRRTMIDVPPGVFTDLATIARTGSVIETTVLVAAAATLAARLKGDGRDVAIACPFAGRIRPEEAEVVGYFVEVLPLRLSGALDQPFADLLTAAHAALKAALAHQDYPLGRIAKNHVRNGGDPRGLFDLVAVLEAAAPEIRDWFDPEVGAGKYDFSLILSRGDDGGGFLTIDYDAAIYDDAEAHAAARRLFALLADAAMHPERPIGDLELFPEAEWHALFARFPASDRALLPPARNVSTLAAWTEAVRRHADRTALIATDGTRLTYAALDRRAEAIARTLTAAGVSGAVVATATERGPDAVAAILAIWKIGAAYLPIDVKWPPAMLTRLATDAGAPAVLADATLAPLLPDSSGLMVIRLDQPAPADAPAPASGADGGSPAYVMFTSGTTGMPKGVVVPHRGILRLAFDRAVFPFGPEDVGIQGAPLAFDASTLELWPVLLNGGSIRILGDDELLAPKRLAAVLKDIGATYVWLTCGLFNRVVDEALDAFDGVKLMMTGGEAVSPPHARRFLTAHPGIRLSNGYGPTENTTLTTTHDITLADTDGPIPIGRPVAGTRVFIVDHRLRPMPVGAWGELVCAGDGVALGYAGQPDLTEAAFVPLPWGDRERVYRTGDLARFRPDGVIEFGGRRDGQVKIRGQRIEIGAIEATLAAQPDIRDAAVVVVGEGVDRVLVAIIVADAARESRWRQVLAETLPLHMMPAQFVVTDALPVNANGKRDRRALLDLIERTNKAGPSASSAPQPRTEAEALMLRLFAELFPAAAIDIDTDFFQLGGHSLLAMRLSNRLEAERGIRLPLREIFAARTVAGIAALLPAAPPPAPSATPEAGGPVGEAPLSPGQERLWVIQKLFPDSGAYNIPIVFDLVGPLDEAALARALVALEDRHHVLRLRIVESGAGPRLRLHPTGELAPGLVDLSARPDPEQAARERLAAETVRPFRLDTENPARALLLRLGGNRRWLVLILHHSGCDGWSLATLQRDLSAFYGRETGGAATIPPAPARAFEQVAAERRAFAASAEGRAMVARWIDRLTPLSEPLALPTDRPRLPTWSFRGAETIRRFAPDLSDALLTLARAEGATPFTLITALVTTFLARLTGQTDLMVGTLVSGRARPELADVVGFLVNTLVLRRDLSGNPSFRRHLAETKTECMRAIADQDCPFEALVEALAARREPGRTPLFDVLVAWQDTETVPLALPGVTVTTITADFPFTKFDLSFHFGLEDSRLTCHLEYATDLFDQATIDAFLDGLDTLATAVVARPDTPVADLPAMSEADRRQVVDLFNATVRPYDTRRTIPRPFLDRLAVDGARTAVLRDGAEPVSYETFARRAGGIARRLAGEGIRPGDTVALAGARSLDLLVAIHGVLMAGAAYVPLGADQPDTRLMAMLEDLGHPLVLADPDNRAAAERAGARVLALGDGSTAEPVDRGSPEGLAYILFTSGSTGRPKGVAIEHHAVLNRLLWMAETFPIGPGDVILQKTPVTFDVSVWELFWWSWTGAAVALPAPGLERDPRGLIDFIERHGVTVMHFVPSMLTEFIGCLERHPDLAARLRRLRFVFASGEALDSELVARFDRTLYRPHGIELHNLYGPTETTVDVTWHPCSPWNGGTVVPIGRPIANTMVYILDPRGRVQPIGVPGEICLGGAQVARGYVGRPELTRERFIPDPFRAGGRLYRSGDRGRIRHDGTIEYLGRIDNQVKIRGQRIEPGEIERALETHPAIERAFVVPAIASGLTELRAFVVTRAAVTAAELRTHLRARVTEGMIPARFLRTIDPPLTSSGKTDRAALKGEPLDGAPAVIPAPPPAATATATATATDEETEIRAIWKALLPDADPSPRDGFFDAGGNSLLVIRLHERLDARWPGIFAVPDLFALATIADQARAIRERTGQPEPPMVTTPLPPPPRPMEPPAPVPATTAAGAIAIVGLAVRVAGADTPAMLWRDVLAGQDRVHPLPADRIADATALSTALGHPVPRRFREAAYLDDIVGFDPRRFRMAPTDASFLDPEQRLFLDTASRALEDAGRGGSALDQARMGVFVGGASGSAWRDAVTAAFPDRLEQVFALNVPSNIATRLSFLHDWRGPAMLIDTACSSALAAVHAAIRALRAGECDWALAGAAKVIPVPPDADTRVTIDSSTGRTRAFAEGADGAGMGEGSAVFLLRPLAMALAEGDPIHAVILGSAVNQDGASSGLTAPNPAAQAEVIRTAAADANVPLATLSYIEAHGTGTALGDPIEIEGLTRAFAAETHEVGFATIGSAKGNYGHLDGAAGALGLARAVLALRHDQAPPQPFFTRPNPRIAFDRAPVRVPTAPTPLADRGTPRRAGISSFGLSGINAHVVIETAPRVVPVDPPLDWVTVCLTAATLDDLRQLANDLVAAMRERPEWPLGAITRTLAEGRDPLDARAAVWVRDRGDLMARLAVFAVAPDSMADLIVTGTAGRGHADRTVPVVHADETAARAAAAAFVAGAKPTWPAGLMAGRLHLPAARPVRHRLFPDFPQTPRPVVQIPPTLRDHIGPAEPRDGGRVYRIDLHARDFWPAAEHKLNGDATLVGAAFPALIAETTPGPIRLHDLRWIRPLRPSEVSVGSVELTIATDGTATLSAIDGTSRRAVFVEAVVTAAPAASETRVDINAALARLGPVEAAPTFDGTSGIVEVSPRWNRLRQGTGNEGERLAWFASPDDGEPLRLHPALLDAMIGTALDAEGHVPTGCRELILWDTVPADPVVHARRTRTPDGIDADLCVIDPATGRIALAINGFRLTRLTGRRTGGEATLSVPVWEPAPATTRDPGEPVVVIGASPLADRLAAYLDATGRLAGRCGDTVSEAVAQRIGAPDAAAIVLALGTGPELARTAAAGLRAILGALRTPTKLLGLGSGAWAVNGTPPIAPDQALVYGAVACAGQEEPVLAARYVDTDDTTAPADLLAELETLEDGPTAIAWRGGQRFVRHFRAATAGPAPQRLPSTGCVVVTGGLGGFALALAPSLAQGGKVALALISRSGRLPDGEDDELRYRRDALDALGRNGARIGLYACDVADRTALAATLDRIRNELGPITGVVHHATSSRGAFLISEAPDVAGYLGAIAAKVAGARHLDALTRDDPLELFLYAGSLTGLTGSAGHAAYTGANAALDALAAERAARGAPALAIDWCGLRGMGMAARLVGDRDGMITPEEARAFLDESLATGAPQVAVLEPVIRAALSVEPAPPSAASPASGPAPAGGGNRALEAGLALIWAETLGYDTVAPDDDFYELGGDSIAGMRIVERIVRDLGRAASLADLMETGSVAALARRLDERAAAQAVVDDTAIKAAPPAERYPVAWEQLAVLQAEAAAEMGTAYNLPVGVELPTDIDEARLRAAIATLVRRHEILRTRLHRGTSDTEPTMEILPEAPPVIESIEAADQTAIADALLAWVRPFDLWNGTPPVRAVLARVGGRVRALVLDVHHALADALSMEVLLNETTQIYAGADLPMPKRQLRDYAWWSRRGPGATGDDEARAYWLDRFKGPVPKLDLPSDRPRPSRHTWRAAVVETPLPGALVEGLRARAAATRTTPFVLMTLVWSLLLSRYARTNDLVIAVPVDARTGADMTMMPGMLVSLVPLRLSSRPNETTGEAIRRVHTQHGEAIRHRSYGLGRLIADLAPATTPDRATLSEVTFSYMNFAMGGGETAAGFEPAALERREGKSDLGLYARDLPEAIVMAIEYYADMFDRDRIERMAHHFQTMLSALVRASDDTPVAALPLIDATERNQLAAWGQGPTATGPIERPLFEIFLDRVAARPDAPALDIGTEWLSYHDLAICALTAAATLRNAGIVPGDRVALRLERDPIEVIWTLAVIAIGATYVPLDPDWPDERTAWVLSDAGCRVVVQEDTEDAPVGTIAVPAHAGLASGTSLDPIGVDRHAPAYVMFTSGSTGTPKGVIVSQPAVARLALMGGEAGIRPDDIVLRTGSPAFDAATLEIWATLLNGARLHVVSSEDVLDPAALATAIRTSRASVMWLTAALFHRQIDVAPESFAPLRLVLSGGDVLSPSHLRRVMAACPDCRFVNGYGPTENTTFTTIHPIVAADTEPGPVPIGRPIAHTRVAVLDPSDAPAPIGIWGEIVTGGDGLAEGYLNRPDLTGEAFIPDPDHDGERLYRTGDLGRFRADGVLEFGGRLDDQIKVRGFRVELGEIERTLSRHPAITAAAALFLPDHLGGGDIILCLTATGEPPGSEELREWAARRLPAHAVPRRFVPVATLPITSNGKLDRRRLIAELPPEETAMTVGTLCSDAERLIARIFSEIFGRPVQDRSADFMALGGHSLSAIRVVNRIAEVTGTRLPMRAFLSEPTVAHLATLIDESQRGETTIPRVPDRPNHPAGHAQTRLYLAHRMDEASAAAFNISTVFPAGPDFDIAALREALTRLVDRHESLRTSFVEEDGRILQRIAPIAEVPLLTDDITAVADPTAECLRLIRREVGQPFDLAVAPLLRARAIRIGPSGWIVLLVLHHIVGDGWSMRILDAELATFYHDARAGRASVLPPLPIAYRDYTSWAANRDWRMAADNRRRALADVPEMIRLPTDLPPPDVPSHRGDIIARPLSPDLSAGLTRLARDHQTTNATIGLALFAGLLHRLTRQNDLVIGLGVAGRDRVEVEGLIGFFVNILPIRLWVAEDAEFSALIAQTRDTVLAAMDFRDYPFDLLVRDVAPKRIGARQPLINVVFEYQRFGNLWAGGDETVFGPDRSPTLDPRLTEALGGALSPPTAKHDLLLFMIEHGDGSTEFRLEFDTDLIDRATAERWLTYLDRFARAVTGDHARNAAE